MDLQITKIYGRIPLEMGVDSMLDGYMLEIFKQEKNGVKIFQEEMLKQLFMTYQYEKEKGVVYSNDDVFPKNLIKLYYTIVDHPRFDMTISKFKDKYVTQESILEDVHEQEEKDGFAEMYEFIHHYLKDSELNIFLILRLHQLLFSKTPFSSFGGSFRNQDIFLPNSGVETENWRNIPYVMQEMYQPVLNLIQEGKELGKGQNVDKVIEYIDKCIVLKCNLVRIHPFYDGNGRTCRAFLNVLFKLANIPFVYVRASEKSSYGKAMSKALVDHDFLYIQRFYYYKICDSIVELDLNNRLTMGYKPSEELERTYVLKK